MSRQPSSVSPTVAVGILLGRPREALADHIRLALTSHRRRLGLSRRALARRRGVRTCEVARVESRAEQVSLGAVIDALVGTGYTLVLARIPPSAPDGALLSAVSAGHRDRAEILTFARAPAVPPSEILARRSA